MGEEHNSQLDLQYAIDHGIIDMSHVRAMIDDMKKNEAIKKHKEKIWQGSGGYWYTYIKKEDGKRRLVKKKNYNDLVAVIVGETEVDRRAPTLSQEFNDWIDDRLRRKLIKKNTRDQYTYVFDKYFDKIKDEKIDQLTEYDYQSFLENVIPEWDLTAKGYGNIVTVLRGILKLAKRQKWITFSVEDAIGGADVSDRQFRKTIKEADEEVFNEDEMTRCIEYLESHRNAANDGLLLIFITGMREGEVVVLTPDNLGEHTVSVRATETKHQSGKGKIIYEVDNFPKTAAGVRDVVVPPAYDWFLEDLKKRCYGQEYVFEKDGERMIAQTLRHRCYAMCDELGITRKSPHKIRKTYCSILLDHGVDSEFIRRQVGHKNLTVTERSYHRDRRNVKQKEDVLSQISDFQ